ncbi:MAG: hypothetical protein RLZZ68_1528 [Bacteroidota bacterium]|jgi:hypothetical protein|nr:hypothetical protein [Flavobacteriia bacterium]NBP29391.1 hypothetical protein [Flavobacteriia bacterium]
MWEYFKRKKEAPKPPEPVVLKPINYPTSIVLLWAKAIEGNQEVQLFLLKEGFPELFHATNAIFLVQDSRDWLMQNGYAHLMAMINTCEGLQTAGEWLLKNNMHLLYHMGRSVDHEADSMQWMVANASQDLVILARAIQYKKDQIEENHNDLHTFGKDL